MKTIGVLGGIGPQATMDFEARLHAASQAREVGRANEAYPPIIVYYHRHPPVAMAGENPIVPARVDPDLLLAAKRVGAWCDFVVVTSNGVHQWREEIERAAGKPVLSMIDLVLSEVKARGWQRVGVIGLGDPTVYSEPLALRGITCETLPGAERDRLDAVIFRFMAGIAQGGNEVAADAVSLLRRRRVDGIVLGCTEVPLLLGGDAEAPDLIDPIALLAEAAVSEALADRADRL